MDIDPSELETIIQGFDANAYLQVAQMALLAYDCALTFADEVRLVWSSRLSLVKILFFLNRLLAFASPVLIFLIHPGGGNPKSCKNMIIAVAYVQYSIFVNSQLMLSTRVYAIWNFDKKVLALLAMLFFPGLAAVIYIDTAALSVDIAEKVPALAGLGCLIEAGSSLEWIGFLIILMQEISLVCLVLLRAFLIARDRGDHTLHGMYRVIVEDNIAYFLCVAPSPCPLRCVSLSLPSQGFANTF